MQASDSLLWATEHGITKEVVLKFINVWEGNYFQKRMSSDEVRNQHEEGKEGKKAQRTKQQIKVGLKTTLARDLT